MFVRIKYFSLCPHNRAIHPFLSLTKHTGHIAITGTSVSPIDTLSCHIRDTLKKILGNDSTLFFTVSEVSIT